MISGFHKPGGEFVFSSKVEWEVTKGCLAEERWDLSNLFKRPLWMLHGEWTMEDQERKQAIIVFLWTYAFISPG